MNCKTHKIYRGIRKPTSTCRKCRFIFALRRILKACGFSVAEIRRAPKGEATKVEDFCKEFGVAVLAPKDDGLTKLSRGYDERRPFFSPEALSKLADQQDAVTLQVAAIKRGAETFEQVRNIGPGAKVQ